MSENRPWLANYTSGVPANINPDAYENLVQFFDECMLKYKNLDAFECMGKRITYKQLDEYSKAFGAYLHSRGLVPGNKLAIMMPNCLQYPIAIIGALRAGLIVVNTNPLYTQREMLHQFEDSEVDAILIIENFAHNLEKILPKTHIKTIITTTVGELLGFKGPVVDFVVKYVKRMVPKFSLPNSVTMKEALSQGKKFTLKEFENCPTDVVMHQYTGGTTGVAKGAMLTNRNLISNVLQISAIMDTLLIEEKEVCLSPLPMYHIFAFTVNCLAMIKLGARTVLVTNARDLNSVIKEFNKDKITIFTGLNTLFNALLHQEKFKDVDFSGLKVTIGGGMAVQKAVAEKWEEVTKCRMAEGYGLTETSPLLSVNPLDGSARLGYIGMPAPSTDMKIVDDEGNELPQGEAGEIIAKGPQVFAGYYKKEEETKNVIKDGWFYTGDIGYMTEDGFFKIVDRKKDMILVSGFNVYPNEIEDELVKHPKILEAAAVGIPSEKSGEAVKAYIVRSDKSLTVEEVRAFCKENMTGYKVPKEVEFRDELPKSNVGKILRRMLKD